MNAAAFKRFFLYALLIVGGILFALIFLEVGLRMVWPAAPRTRNDDLYRCSNKLGWVGKANYEGENISDEYSHHLKFNADGMYDTQHPLENASGAYRILWVGDSYAQALQVPESETAHQQLEDKLNEQSEISPQAFEVISAAVGGWGNDQQLIYYREQGQKYQPDMVLLLFFVGNDVLDSFPGKALTLGGYNCFAPYFPLCADGRMDLKPWAYIPGIDPAWRSCSPWGYALTTILSPIKQNSFAFARLEPLLLKWKPRRSYGNEIGLGQAIFALYFPDQSEELKYGWDVTENLLLQFADEVRQNGSEFAVGIVGPYEAIQLGRVTDYEWETIRQRNTALADAELDRPNRRLINFLQAHNIPVIDLQQPMIDYSVQNNTELYLAVDRHWTVEGNRVSADILFTWLRDNHLLPED